MKPYSSGIGRKLYADLHMLSKHVFAERCGSILQTVFSDVRATPSDGMLDRSGIDYCLCVPSQDKIELAFQCKGFEVPEWTSSQTSQCIHSIESFAQGTLKTECYILIVNRVVKGEARVIIEDALARLVQSQRVTKVLLYDLEAFLEFVFIKIQDQVLILIQESVATLKEERQQRMQEGIYVEDVPFSLQSGGKKKNPLRFVEEYVLKLIREPNNRRSWTFVVSEFGFGKTALALQLAGVFLDHGTHCLYLPAARFPDKTLEMEKEFMWTVLEFLQEDVDRHRERDEMRQAALKEIFKREKSVVLILDGIDEHPACWREGGLANVLGIFKTFNATCVFTVREEFLAERNGHFKTAMRNAPGWFTLHLTEWDEPLVLEYTKQWRDSGLPNEVKPHLDDFDELVRNGHYVDLYGDIPKRPLFLKMLLTDVAAGDLRNRNLAELYLTYFKNKFHADRATSTDAPAVRRPLNINEDSELVCAILLEIMTLAAGQMYRIEVGGLFLEPRLLESQLRKCADLAGGSLDVASIAINSVLLPVGRRDANREKGNLVFTFAHQSFQEFFLARHLLTLLSKNSLNPTIPYESLPKAVIRFAKDLFPLFSEGEQTHIREFCVLQRLDIKLFCGNV
jgi:hypothetical protein